MAILLRRRKLGRTSCREITKLSTSGIVSKRNDIVRDSTFDEHDLVFRWGCTSTVPIRNVVNTARAIHEVNDKLGFRKILNEAGLCPKTWFSLSDWLQESGGFPKVVLRPAVHSRGRNILLHSLEDESDGSMAVDGFISKFPDYYISEYIPKVAEYRVCVVQGRVAWVAKKTPANPEDIAWNVANGGRFDNVRWDDWDLRTVRVAVEAFNLSSLDFGGVDVMVDADGKAYILEINSAPSLTSPYRQQCMAKSFDYIVRNGKEKIPLIEERGGYRKFIHPAVCERAILVGE